MKKILFPLFIIIFRVFEINCKDADLKFPEGFSFAAASSAYQVEGGWNVSDKGENVWDWTTHNYPSEIFNGDNGDVACDSYNKYKEDVQLLKKIGFQVYRFSISWARILPFGFSHNVSKTGIQYYKNLIDELLANGIEPCVTLYHWDHPQLLQKYGGWTNELMVDWFGDYARVIFRELGSRVKYFTTINEPQIICNIHQIYGPGTNVSGTADYLCLHNVLKAHARAYHIYDKEFRAKQKGLISIVNACAFFLPKTSNDQKLVDIAFELDCGLIGNPIFSKKGDYPDVVKERIDENSKLQGWPRSRLPKFSQEWINYIRGTADFFAVNHYTIYFVESVPKTNGTLWYQDRGYKKYEPVWSPAADGGFERKAIGFRRLLNKIKQNYGDVPIFILENGLPVEGYLDDTDRVYYYHAYMKELLNAINHDKCNVQLYTLWSLLDNFEWTKGYSKRFGITFVDFKDPNRKRTMKLSAYWLKDVINARQLLPIDKYLSDEFKTEHNIS